jgi:hypothetical protein
MPGRLAAIVATILALTLLLGSALAQWPRGRGRRDFDPTQVDRNGVPEWKVDERFKHDIFTFVRVRYTSYGGRYGGWGGKWATDYPDSDLNFSFRLQQLTTLETDPYGKILELTDEAIFDYPWLYLIEPGNMVLDEAEVQNLRKYLLHGGFLMVDDFWGEAEWANFYENIKRVFPEREPIELPLEHEIFHCVYDLKKKPQIPSIHAYLAGHTTERWDAPEPHYKGIFDDKGRMMVLICHNTDVGDGWEREGVDPGYFKEYSERWSYPLGINILVYAMTH